MGKIKLQKIVGNLLDKLRKLYMNGMVIQKFLAFLKLQKIVGNYCFSEQIFHRKQSLGAPKHFFCSARDRRSIAPKMLNLFQHCWGHARTLHTHYDSPRCTAGRNFVGEFRGVIASFQCAPCITFCCVCLHVAPYRLQAACQPANGRRFSSLIAAEGRFTWRIARMKLLRRPISASDRIPDRFCVISMEFLSLSRRRSSSQNFPQRR